MNALRRTATLLVAALFLTALPVAPAAASAPHRAMSTGILAFYMTPDSLTPQNQAVTVGFEVASTANIQQVWFTFCQITSSQCYLPTTMNLTNSNWYVGQTHPMTAYKGMNVGIQAGINITITFADSSTQFLPALPNAYTNLTLAQLPGTGEWAYAMTVSPQVFGLTGHVVNSTGSPVGGASVALVGNGVPAVVTNSSGAYSFSGLVNGSYTLSISKPGYAPQNLTVAIAGATVTKDVQIAPPAATGSGPKGTAAPFFSTPAGLAVIGLLIAIVLIVTALALRRRRRPGAPASGPGEVDPTAAPAEKT